MPETFLLRIKNYYGSHTRLRLFSVKPSKQQSLGRKFDFNDTDSECDQEPTASQFEMTDDDQFHYNRSPIRIEMTSGGEGDSSGNNRTAELVYRSWPPPPSKDHWSYPLDINSNAKTFRINCWKALFSNVTCSYSAARTSLHLEFSHKTCTAGV